jgi:TolA-binding protein
LEGSAVVRVGRRSITLAAGESARESDSRLTDSRPAEAHPLAPVFVRKAAPPPVTTCPSRAPTLERLACLEDAARGSGLTGQNALYVLALMAEQGGRAASAVDLWRRYGGRFPDGVLAPEARVALLNDLVSLQRYPEALHEAEAFLSRYPHEPAAPQVLRLRDSLRSLQEL